MTEERETGLIINVKKTKVTRFAEVKERVYITYYGRIRKTNHNVENQLP